MPSQHTGARSINPKPQTPEERCLGDVYAKINLIISNVETRLTKELNRPDLTLAIGGRPVETNGVVAQGFENVTGLTQSSLTPADREMRLNALISEKTRQLLLSPPAIAFDYQAYIQSFGVSIAHKPGDPGFSPVEMKRQSEEHLRERITEAVEDLTRKKFNQLAANYIDTPHSRTYPDLTPLMNIQERILSQQQDHQRQQQEYQQQRLQQQAEQNVKKPEQIAAEKIRKEIGDLLRPKRPLNHDEIYKWIEKGLDLAQDKERLVEKLKDTGLISYRARTTTDPETGAETKSYKIYPGETKSGYFKGLKATSLMSWGGTIAVSALALVAAPAGAGGLAVALGVVGVVNALNLGAQSFLKKLHKNTFENTWKELQSELGTMDPKRAPALAGLMYLFVDKYSPVILFKNQTSFTQWGRPTSTAAVLDHLKEASAAALNNVSGTSEGYYKGVDVKEKISLAKKGLDNLEKRWGWHWEASTWWASTLTTTSFLGALGFGASAFL